MTKANLEGKVVGIGFWPKCGNCKHYETCEQTPKHEAFPHSWHWSREAVEFSDATVLILQSWVGTSGYEVPHTGCYSYRADDALFIEMDERHQKYLELESERQRLEQILQSVANRGQWDEGVAQRLTEITNEQDALREAV